MNKDFFPLSLREREHPHDWKGGIVPEGRGEVCLVAPSPFFPRAKGEKKIFTILILCLMLIAAGCAGATKNRVRMRPLLVKAVHFTGNASISSTDLLSRMDTKPGWIFHRTKFSKSLLNADIDAIAYLYRDKGFLGIQVHVGDIIRDPSSHRVRVNIVINEGPQTRIDSITLKGLTVMGDARIKRFIQSKPFAPYSAVLLSYDQQTIRDSMAARGYPLCAVDRIDSVDTIAHSASVVFLIDQGPLAKAGPVTVSGAKKLREVIVKRGLTFKQGDTLTTGQILRSVKQLYETGMFKYAQITTPVADSAQQRRMAGPITLPVLLTIEEADFFKLQGGIGYGTYEGVRLSLQTSYGNVLGLGRTIGLNGKYSRLIQSLHLNYTAPWAFLLPPTGEVDVFGEHHDEVTFTGFLEGVTFSLFAKTPWNLGYRVFNTFEWINGVVIPPHPSDTTPFIPNNNTQSFGTGVTYDTRDNMFDPSKGLFASSDAEVAGLIGSQTNHFYKLVLDVRGVLPIGHLLNAASAITVGYVNGYGADAAIVPPQELFYSGSATIRPVRGYAPGGVGDSIGGRLVLVLNVLELRYAIVKWLKIAGFADAGFVWGSAKEFSLRELLWTAGPGIRIRTPIGLLSADLGIRVNGPTRGKFGFSVSIGEPF
jgi:outer membrane protein insertion porin family